LSDVVVIGAGVNGLVAANLVAEAGLHVVVCEEQPWPGGAVRSASLTLPGFEHDVFSAFYPFAVASPVIQALRLERWGLSWCRAPLVVAHPTLDGPTAVLSTDLHETVASLDRFASGDGAVWRRLYGFWRRAEEPFMQAFTTPVPPIRAGMRLAGRLRGRGLLEFARIGLVPLRRFAQENFRGAGGGLLLAGNALHADLTPDSIGGAMFGLILCGLGQTHGFPVPQGGSSRLTEALVRRLHAHGGELICGTRVDHIAVRRGRAVGVRLTDQRRIAARVGVLADVGAPQLYRELLDRETLPERVHSDIERFQYDNATVKVDWALAGPIPWTSPEARRAGTLHLADGFELLSQATVDLERGLIPAQPFLVFGQYSPLDDTRQPAGTETAWAYTHVPQVTRGDAAGELKGSWDAIELNAFAQRIEAQIERFAPGFKRLVLARNILGPHELEHANRNLVNGAINGGTARYHQQLVFRPIPGLGRPETPIDRLLLSSASAHPGGGVHGAPGAIAARALLTHHRARRLMTPPPPLSRLKRSSPRLGAVR
jgi:phytoene dehydrogenase-like protein